MKIANASVQIVHPSFSVPCPTQVKDSLSRNGHREIVPSLMLV